MSLIPFANYRGLYLGPTEWPAFAASGANRTMDAAGESVTCIGRVYLTTGPGTSKTISSSGGKIYYRPGANTFASGSTNLRIGIQDVASTGIEDTTFDVYADLVGGTDTITTSVVNTIPMESGSKTIAHGDFIAIVFEMTARGGADSVIIPSVTGLGGNLPYLSVDTGSGPAKVNSQFLPLTIEFDDGTMGTFGGGTLAVTSEASGNMNTGSTPDEVALIFAPLHNMTVVGMTGVFSLSASSRDAEMALYADPLGTPSQLVTATIDADLVGLGNASPFDYPFTSAVALTAGTTYGLSFRPTTGSNITYSRLNFGSGNGNLRKVTPLGTDWYLASRSDMTGAFGSADTTILPNFGLWVAQMDDGAGSGGGGGGLAWPVGRAI